MQEKKKRTLIKTLTAKLMEISISAIIVQIIFGEPFISLGLPLLLEGCQMVGYYFHERLWNRIEWASCQECHFKEFHEKRRREGKSHD